MILAFDTFYFEDKAKTVALEFESWTNETITKVYEETISGIDEYIPGEFYKRELPCILSLLKQIDLTHCQTIIIDGFVVLNDEDAIGLGGYLYQELEEKIPILGVAKNNYAKINKLKRAVYRGESKKPLYVTAKGLNLDVAAESIKQMAGNYRFPDLLKQVDSLGRL